MIKMAVMSFLDIKKTLQKPSSEPNCHWPLDLEYNILEGWLFNVCSNDVDLDLVNPFPHRNAFANRADPDLAALVRADWSWSTLSAYRNMTYLILH